jgi:hypothetical protein
MLKALMPAAVYICSVAWVRPNRRSAAVSGTLKRACAGAGVSAAVPDARVVRRRATRLTRARDLPGRGKEET